MPVLAWFRLEWAAPRENIHSNRFPMSLYALRWLYRTTHNRHWSGGGRGGTTIRRTHSGVLHGNLVVTSVENTRVHLSRITHSTHFMEIEFLLFFYSLFDHHTIACTALPPASSPDACHTSRHTVTHSKRYAFSISERVERARTCGPHTSPRTARTGTLEIFNDKWFTATPADLLNFILLCFHVLYSVFVAVRVFIRTRSRDGRPPRVH